MASIRCHGRRHHNHRRRRRQFSSDQIRSYFLSSVNVLLLYRSLVQLCRKLELCNSKYAKRDTKVLYGPVCIHRSVFSFVRSSFVVVAGGKAGGSVNERVSRPNTLLVLVDFGSIGST